MGRQTRQMSESGFYHIVFRGVNRQHLFEDDRDYLYFIDSLKNLKAEMVFEVHAYCLMSNHVHLILREKQLGDISTIMKRLLTKYAMYFNRQYERCGTLFSNRYKSIPIETDEYFIPLVSYIHQNPVKGGIVKKLEEYRFSSFIDYVYGGGLTDTDFSLNFLGKNEWLRLHQVIQRDNIDSVDKMRLSEEEIRRRILQYTDGKDPHEVTSWTKKERNVLLKQLKEKERLSIRQIERATGISRGVVAKC